MDITDYIPRGQEHAISRRDLARLTGLSDREVRYYIERYNQEGDEPIICLLDGRGYFIPLQSERDLVWKCIANETSRSIN